jgi:hypothetical protein
MNHRGIARGAVGGLIVAASVGCSRQPAAETHSASQAGSIRSGLPACNEPDQNPSGEKYLPAGQMGPWDTPPDKRDQYARDVFSSELRALGEPTMLGARQSESYRLMMELSPVQLLAIRAEPGRIHTAVVEPLPIKSVEERADASSPEKEFGPRGCRARVLSASEWSDIRECFDKRSFWTAPTGRPPWHMFDATSWIIEARRQEQYHFVVRIGRDPNDLAHDDTFMDCARLLIGFSGMGNP